MAKKSIVVTGAAGLIGAYFCEVLVSRGAIVHAIDVDSSKLDILTKSLASYGGSITPYQCDVTQEKEVKDAINAIRCKSKIDVLINCAAKDDKFDTSRGVGRPDSGAFSDYPLDKWRSTIDVNITGTFLVSREVCAAFEDQGYGNIVTIGSTYGLVGPDQRIYLSEGGVQNFKSLDYPTSKAAVIGFTKALASYYRGTQIRANCLCPGGIENGHSPNFVRLYSERTISGRMAKLEDYAGAILFLCSPASEYMTGGNLTVDGGWTAV